MSIKLNSNIGLVEKIRQQLKENNGQCPCVPKELQNEDTKCPCKEFRESEKGQCHCGLFIKLDD